MDVELLPWPAESGRRRELAGLGAPRLLLVSQDSPAPPAEADCLEDWVRLPTREGDIQARISTLAERWRTHGSRRPELDGHGVLRFGDGWVALPPVEERLISALLERFGAVASRELLLSAAWPHHPPERNVLDVHVVRMRRRLRPIGLAIRTVRRRGYLLEPVR